jgi:ABC-type Fe3+ transport system permease subunit
MYAIDVAALQPLVNELVLAALTALASVVVARACALLKAKRDGELGQILDKTLGMGLAYAMSKLKALEDGNTEISV